MKKSSSSAIGAGLWLANIIINGSSLKGDPYGFQAFLLIWIFVAWLAFAFNLRNMIEATLEESSSNLSNGSGTFVVPAGVKYVKISMVGGGAGGSGEQNEKV